MDILATNSWILAEATLPLKSREIQLKSLAVLPECGHRIWPHASSQGKWGTRDHYILGQKTFWTVALQSILLMKEGVRAWGEK